MYEYEETYRDWSVKNVLASTVIEIKQIAVLNELTIPEVISECVNFYRAEFEGRDEE